MSVLENFLRVTAVLTVLLFGINVFIDVFGAPMTGETIAADVQINRDINGVSITTIVQSSIIPTDTSMDLTPWDSFFVKVKNVALGWQTLLLKIFQDIDPTVTENYATLAVEDPVEGIAAGLITLITMFQVFGVVYIVFTFIVILRGGGSSI